MRTARDGCQRGEGLRHVQAGSSGYYDAYFNTRQKTELAVLPPTAPAPVVWVERTWNSPEHFRDRGTWYPNGQWSRYA